MDTTGLLAAGSVIDQITAQAIQGLFSGSNGGGVLGGVLGHQVGGGTGRDLATIATTIARFEPVSMLVRPEELDQARGLIGAANVELIPAPIDDLWIRDTGPVFVTGADGWGGVDFNFNGWGGKQEHRRDGKVAEFVATRAGVETIRIMEEDKLLDNAASTGPTTGSDAPEFHAHNPTVPASTPMIATAIAGRVAVVASVMVSAPGRAGWVRRPYQRG